ncbi:MAG: D-aminoacyl-tRNA deacylase [Lentimicrobium sp.]
MRVVIQRVNRANVKIDERMISEIGHGLLVLCGFEQGDEMEDLRWVAGKVSRLRIFDDEAGTMNLSVVDKAGEIMVISQFTLHASTKKGNRPSYIRALEPLKAKELYQRFVEELTAYSGIVVKTGIFGAHMMIELVNDGPVTIIIDSKMRE